MSSLKNSNYFQNILKENWLKQIPFVIKKLNLINQLMVKMLH